MLPLIVVISLFLLNFFFSPSSLTHACIVEQDQCILKKNTFETKDILSREKDAFMLRYYYYLNRKVIEREREKKAMQIEDVGTSLKEERKRIRAKQIELSHDCLMSVIRTVFLFSDSHFLMLFSIRLEFIQHTHIHKKNNHIVMQILIYLFN